MNPPRPHIAMLPDPPMIEHYLLEQPWPLAVILLLSGLVGGYLLLRRGKLPLALSVALVGTALAAMTLWLAASTVTLREQLNSAATTLVDAVAKADSDTVGSILAHDITTVLTGKPTPTSHARITEFVRDKMAGPLKLQECEILFINSTLDGPNTGRTQVRVRIVPIAIGVPNSSWWVLSWRRDPAGLWQVTQIESQHIEGAPPGFNPGF